MNSLSWTSPCELEHHFLAVVVKLHFLCVYIRYDREHIFFLKKRVNTRYGNKRVKMNLDGLVFMGPLLFPFPFDQSIQYELFVFHFFVMH